MQKFVTSLKVVNTKFPFMHGGLTNAWHLCMAVSLIVSDQEAKALGKF